MYVAVYLILVRDNKVLLLQTNNENISVKSLIDTGYIHEEEDNLGINHLIELSEKYMDNETKHNIYIGTDMDIILDFIEPVYIWAKGGTLKEVYAKTQVYEGNFVKLILRINNIMMNLKY